MASLFELIASFFRKFTKKEEAKPRGINMRKPRTNFRITKKKAYKLEVAVVFDGKPVGRVAMMNEGYSRDSVADEAQEKLTLKVISCVQIKKVTKKEDNEIPKSNIT
jgi:hypothetical protein